VLFLFKTKMHGLKSRATKECLSAFSALLGASAVPPTCDVAPVSFTMRLEETFA
jgi:hypothetical protein